MIYTPTRVYNDVVKDIKRVNCLRGGTRSTKSFSLTQLAVRWLMYGKVGSMDIPTGDFFILRESFPALRRTVLKDFITILSREGFLPYVNHIKTTNEFTRHNRTVSFFSADDESKIHGPQNTIFWINEATAVKYNVFNQLIFRCSQFCFLDYNPNDPDSWVKTKIEDERMLQDKDVSLDVSVVYDNPHLSDAQLKEIESIKDQELREVYLKGNWTKLTGLIYPNFEIVNELPEEFEKRYYGVDFGWIDPTALVEVRQQGNNIFVKEHIYESKYDYPQLAAHIHAYIPACRGAADSAAPRAIDTLRKHGIKVKAAKKGPDTIVTGIQHVRTHNIFVTSDSVNLIKELKSYKWKLKPDADTREGDDKYIQKPNDEYNHLCDALRYAVTTLRKKKACKQI